MTINVDNQLERSKFANILNHPIKRTGFIHKIGEPQLDLEELAETVSPKKYKHCTLVRDPATGKNNKKWYTRKLPLHEVACPFMSRHMPKNCKHFNYVLLTKFVVQSN